MSSLQNYERVQLQIINIYIPYAVAGEAKNVRIVTVPHGTICVPACLRYPIQRISLYREPAFYLPSAMIGVVYLLYIM